VSDSDRGPSGGPPPGAPRLPPHLDPRGRAAQQQQQQQQQGPDPRLPRPGSAAVLPQTPRRRAPGLRALSWVAGALSVAVFAVSALGWVLYSKYNGQISRIPGLSTALPGLTKPDEAPRDARNVLLVGSDSRANVGKKFGSEGGQRSDTIILAHLYGDSDAARLVSFPRDSWVTIPGYTDPDSGTFREEHEDKINAAINEGGPALLIATIERMTNIRVDNYVQIDFAGFQKMVDRLGGVEVCLLQPAEEVSSGIDLPAGRQIVRGEQALAFVRQRKGLPNGDIDRIKRQQAFIASLTRTALSSGTLLNVTKLNGFLDAATESVDVDDSLSGAGLTQLALRMRNFSAGGVSFSTVPYSTIGARRNGQSVVLVDDAKAATLFEALRRDVAPARKKKAGGGSRQDPLVVAPSAVRVAVYNAAGVAGLGGRAVADLQRVGFTVSGSPANRGTGATGTVVRYGPTRADSAKTLAAAVPGATLEADAALGSTLELVVGSSYAGTQTVTVGATPSATPTAEDPDTPSLTADEQGCVN